MEQNPLKKNKVGGGSFHIKFVYSDSVKVIDYFLFLYINILDAIIYLILFTFTIFQDLPFPGIGGSLLKLNTSYS